MKTGRKGALKTEETKNRLYGGKTEEQLSPAERLGLAYCRLEGLAWDDHIGEKPKGWDNAPDNVKHFIVQRHLQRIEAMLGETYLDRCRAIYDSGISEQEWLDRQARMWENGSLSLGHNRNDVTNKDSILDSRHALARALQVMRHTPTERLAQALSAIRGYDVKNSHAEFVAAVYGDRFELLLNDFDERYKHQLDQIRAETDSVLKSPAETRGSERMQENHRQIRTP